MWSQYRKIIYALVLVLWQSISASASSGATAHDSKVDITYTGVSNDGVEVFYGIHYGQDTSGENRFKPPKAYVPTPGSTINAIKPGPACPQEKGDPIAPLYLSNITEISEDCLHLNVYRPAGTAPGAKLPVMLYIHGGSFVFSSKDDIVIQPEGLIKQSVEIGIPVISVNINYRLGVFGFAQSAALKAEGSENAGLRDQRLAIEWARSNIACFGGDPENIEILGQSSGGLAMGMQMLAFGGSKGFSFQKVSAESQILEPGITGEFTIKSMASVADSSGCNATDVNTATTVSCLRGLSMQELLHSQIHTYHSGPASNIGDKWLPVVDGDFLPEAPSKLIADGKFAQVTTMVGWCEGDGNLFVPFDLNNTADVFKFFRAYLPGFTDANVNKLLSLYPVSDFSANPSAGLTAQVYRAGRLLRDILFTCQPFYFGQALADAGNDVYMWVQNQTMFDEILTSLGEPGLGAIHTSNFAYEFHHLSAYNVDSFPYHPNKSDHALAVRQSRSWASFANTGRPSLRGQGTLKGWTPAFVGDDEIDIFVVGGPHEGLSPIDGPDAKKVVAAQKLRERCGFLNSPEIIAQLDY